MHVLCMLVTHSGFKTLNVLNSTVASSLRLCKHTGEVQAAIPFANCSDQQV